MTRTTLYKCTYFAYFVGVGLLFYWATKYFKVSAVMFVGLMLLLFLPGRVLGYFWRDLMRGLRLLNAGQYEESKRHSAAFLDQVHARPWLKRLIWLGTSSYSRDPESMAFNPTFALRLISA